MRLSVTLLLAVKPVQDVCRSLLKLYIRTVYAGETHTNKHTDVTQMVGGFTKRLKEGRDVSLSFPFVWFLMNVNRVVIYFFMQRGSNRGIYCCCWLPVIQLVNLAR